MADRIPTFEAFWPYYVDQHRLPANRALHFVGTTGTILNALAAVLTLNPVLLLSAAGCGYFFAWIGHFGVEKNRPATFTYPLWSLRADFCMYGLMLTRRMGPEIARLQKAA